MDFVTRCPAMRERRCENCRYWEDGGAYNMDENDAGLEDHICVNGRSPHVADWTEANDSCDYWEGKEQKK